MKIVAIAISEVVRETDKAILVRLMDDQSFWFPKSQATLYELPNTFALTMPIWLFRDKVSQMIPKGSYKVFDTEYEAECFLNS